MMSGVELSDLIQTVKHDVPHALETKLSLSIGTNTKITDTEVGFFMPSNLYTTEDIELNDTSKLRLGLCDHELNIEKLKKSLWF